MSDFRSELLKKYNVGAAGKTSSPRQDMYSPAASHSQQNSTDYRTMLLDKYSPEKTESRQKAVSDWATRFNGVMQGISNPRSKSGNWYTRSAIDSFGSDIDSLIQDYDSIKDYAGRLGIPNAQRYLKQLQEVQSQIQRENGWYQKYRGSGYNEVEDALSSMTAGDERSWLEDNRYDIYKTVSDYQQRVQSGMDAFEASKPKDREEESWFEAIGRYLGKVSDTTMALGDTGRMSQEYRKDTKYKEPAENWTEDQRNTYGYLYSINPEAASDFAVKTSENYRRAENQQKLGAIQEWATKNGKNATAGTVAAIAMMPLSLADTLNALTEYNARGTISTPSSPTPGQVSEAITGAVGQSLNEKHGTISEKIPVIGGKGWGDAYQLGTSIANSLLSAYTQGSVGTDILFFGSAASSSMYSAKDRGATDEQAIKLGVLSGLAEAAGEHFSIEGLIGMSEANTMKAFFGNILKQSGIEASEEGFTTLMNNFADQLIMGKDSTFYEKVRTYMSENGMSEQEAEKQAWKDMAEDLAFDMVGGAISGGVSTGIQTGAQKIFGGTEQAQTHHEPLTTDQDSLTTELANDEAVAEESSAVDDKVSATESTVGKNESSTAKVGVSKMETVQQTADIESFAEQFGTQADAVRRNYMEGQDLQEYEVGFQTAYAMGLEGGKQEALGSVPYLSQSQREIAFSLGRDAAAAQKAAAPKKAAVTAKMTTEEGTQDVTIAEVVDMDDTTMTFRLEDGRTVTDNDLDFEKGQKLMAAAWELGMDIKAVNTIVTESAANTAADADQAAGIQQAHHYGQHGYTMEQLTKYGADAAALTDGQRKAAWEAGRQIYLQKAAEPAPALKAPKTSGVWFDAGGGNVRSFDDADLSGLSEAAVAGARAAQVLQKLGIGKNYYFYESYVNKAGERVYKDENGQERKAPNGWYDPDGSIHIDLNAGAEGKGLTMYTLSHELTHFVEKWSPKKYQALADFLVSNYAKAGNVDVMVAEKQAELSAGRDSEVSYEDAYSEFIADSMEAMLSDGNVLEKLQELKKTDKSLFDKIREFFDNLGKKIREIYKDLTPDSLEGQAVLQMKDQIDQIQQLFAEALTEASENFLAAAEIGLEVDMDTESVSPAVLYSERTWKESDYVQERNKAAQEISKAIGVSVKKARQYIDSVNGIAKMIAEDRTRLDYFSSPGRSSFIGNVEYGGSFDFSTLCKKRRLLTGTFTAIQKALPNTALTANEILDIRNRMKDAGLEVSCGLCYVEGSRANMGQFAKEFLRLYKQYYPDAWQPNMADVNTPDGIEWVRINHPECYEQYEYFWNHYGTLKDGDKNLFASQQKPKLYQLHTEYKGEILQKFKGDDNVEEKNLNGGIRLQSFSDFEIVHLIDTMQIIMDMSRVGLAGQAYTKVPDFAWALGDTGLKINLSLIAKGVDESGNLIFDDIEGMPIAEAMKLRDRYSANVGTILVAFNDAQLMAAMADDRVDFIIPFHRSQWKKSQYEAMGLPAKTKDYTFMQNEKFIKPQYHEYRGRMVKDKATNYMPNEYWDFSKSGKENAEAYLQMCARNNKRPKFYKLLENNGDGSYSLKADGSTDGYWKLLIDFKMYDNDGIGSPQMPVRPDFNMEESARMMREYKGGHSSFPVAQGIVDSFVSEYKENHGDRMYSDRKTKHQKITMSMTDSERTEILKDKVITAEVYDGQADKTIAAEKENLKSHRDNLVKAALVKIGEEFGVFTDYSISDVDIDIRLSRGNLKESVSKKINPMQIAKLMPVLKTAVENAVGVECHANRYFFDNDTVMFENLIGGYVDGTYFVPVRFGLKHSVSGKATLYLIVDQEQIDVKKIKAEVAKATAVKSDRPKTSRSAFNISLASITPFVNGKDLLRYLPDDMLNNQQKEAKYEALAETVAYTNEKNDRKYTEYIRAGKLSSAKQMVEQAAKVVGYNIKLHHGTAGEPFYVFRLGAEGIHFGTLAQATQRVDATRERLQYEHRTYTTEEIRRNLSSIPQAARQHIVEDAVSGRNSLSDAEVITGYDLADGSKIITDEDLLYYLDKSEREKYSLANGIMGINIDGRVVDAYVKAEHPVVFDVDIGEWTAYNIADILIRKIKGQKTEIYSLAKHDWVDYDPAGITGIDLTDADIPELERLSQEREFSAIAEFLQSKGADSVRYLNTYEGSKNEESYILLSPEQVKLADAITYDDNGNIVPISQRFNPENKDIRYQARATGTSNRDLLAGAFEDLARSPAEMEFIQKYQENVALLNEQEQKLQNIRTEIRELTFGKGPKDPKRLEQLQEEAGKTANRIHIYDKKLLQLEAAKPLRDVLDREREKVRKATRQKGQEAMAEYREKRKESAARKDAKRKIRKTIAQLNKLLTHGNKKQNVKKGMEDFAATALASAEILFTDNISNEDMILNGIGTQVDAKENRLIEEVRALLQKRKDLYNLDAASQEMEDIVFTGESESYAQRMAESEKLDRKISEKMRQLKGVFERERNRLNEATVSGILEDLAKAYKSLGSSDALYIRAATDERVYQYLTQLKDTIGGTTVQDMSAAQLKALSDAYTMVLTTIRNANKAFTDGRSIQAEAEQMAAEFRSRKIPEKALGIAAKKVMDSIGWNYEKLHYALDRIGSPTLSRLFNNLADSENITMRDVQEAKAYQKEMVEKYHYNDWKIDQKIDHPFVDNTGKKFHLTLGELMALYAYSRRDGADRHIEYGGFKLGKSALTDPKPATTYKLTAEQLAKITEMLTEEQRTFAEGMQKYLSETMGAKGNEVSMKLYGIEMFKEENYFPLHIAGEFKAQAQESQAKAAAGFQTMSNAGFTQTRNKESTAPIVLEDFMSVWADHVNEMARYHGAVPALEDIRRVMNYSVYSDADSESMSVEAAMTNAFGKQAVQYFDNLYREANSGAITDKLDAAPKKMLSLFRKNAVAYSVSVWIQQPASIYRARMMVDRKYFGRHGFFTLTGGVLRILNRKKWNTTYEEMMRYAPGVTMAKEIGGFDTSTGSSIRSYLMDTEKSFSQSMKNDTAKDKAKSVLKLVDDNAIANLPNVMDKVAWIEMWEACKRETVARNPQMETDSKAFLEKVGHRFTEVIRGTQVYDSMFAKSPMLKTNNLFVQSVVSFMNESNTVANMAEATIRDLARGNKKQAAKTASALVTSIVANELLKSIVYAMRDDDEDETLLEKYISAVAGSLIDDVTVFNYVPYARDVWSVWQGYDAERADMAIVSDAVSAVKKLSQLSGEDAAAMTEEELLKWSEEVTDARWAVAETLSPLFGIPLKNIRRDMLAVFNAVKIRGLDKERQSTALSIRHTVEDAIWQGSKSGTDRLYEAMVAGDDAYVQRLRNNYKSDDAYHAAIKKALRDNDSRIWEAAVAWNAGELETYIRIAKEIRGEGRFDQDDIVLAIRAEANSMLEKDDSSSDKVYGYFTAEKFGVAMSQGNTTMADMIRQDLIDTDIANGKTREEAEKSVQSKARTQLKELYTGGTISASTAEKMLVKYAGKSYEEADELVSEWQFDMDYPDSDISFSDYQKWEDNGKGLGISLEIYTEYKTRTKGIENDKDVNGNSIPYTAVQKIMTVINSLPLSESQKYALARSQGWSEKTIQKYKQW